MKIILNTYSYRRPKSTKPICESVNFVLSLQCYECWIGSGHNAWNILIFIAMAGDTLNNLTDSEPKTKVKVIQTMDLEYKDILSRLALIEKHLGYSTMSFYSPISNTYSEDNGLLNVQREASQMIKHVGLERYMPVITFTETGYSVGGNVELDNSENVFIEINKKYRNNSEKIRAVMAHEICHKVLFVHGLYFSDSSMSLENEYLTDLATVYVGFGKLSLNGCYNEREIGTTTNEIPTTVIKETLGYISFQSFVTAYGIVCNRFGVSKLDMLEGLSDFAYNKVVSMTPCSQYKQFKVEDIKDTIKTAQETVSTAYKNILILENILFQAKIKIREQHIAISNDLVSPINYDDETLSRQQLIAALAMSKYENPNEGFHQFNKSVSKLIDDFRGEKSNLVNCDEICNMLKDIECPICGFKKTQVLKENKKVFIRCKKCNYLFLWDGELPPKKKVWFRKLFKR